MVEGHFKSVMLAKVMLLLLSLDIVNFKIKLVIIVGYGHLCFKMYLLFKVSRVSGSPKNCTSKYGIAHALVMCMNNTAF